MSFEKTGLALKTVVRLAVLCCLTPLIVVASSSVASANCEPILSYHYTYYCDAAHTQVVGEYNVDCDQVESSWGQVTSYYTYCFSYCGCIEG